MRKYYRLVGLDKEGYNMKYMDIDLYNELKEIEDRIFDISATLETDNIIEGIWFILYDYLNTVTPVEQDEE